VKNHELIELLSKEDSDREVRVYSECHGCDIPITGINSFTASPGVTSPIYLVGSE
jgi:hypothetical protein